jgi:hypothetical protein
MQAHMSRRDALLVTAARDVLAVGREQLAPVASGFENSGSRLISMPLLGEAFAEDAGLVLPSLTADSRGRTAVPHPSSWDLRADREAIEGVG